MKSTLYAVQFTLRAGIDGPACSFTSHIPFSLPPSVGHTIILECQDQIGTAIVQIYHFIPSDADKTSAVLLNTAPIIFDDSEKMLRMLDWFKAIYHVEDIKSDTSRPDPYYSFYRSLVNILDLSKVPSPKVDYDRTKVKVFAECCRAVILAEMEWDEDEFETAVPLYNDNIASLHNMIIGCKSGEPDGADMLSLVRRWERSINEDGAFKWEAPVQSCQKIAKYLLRQLPSIKPENLPATLRD